MHSLGIIGAVFEVKVLYELRDQVREWSEVGVQLFLAGTLEGWAI